MIASQGSYGLTVNEQQVVCKVVTLRRLKLADGYAVRPAGWSRRDPGPSIQPQRDQRRCARGLQLLAAWAGSLGGGAQNVSAGDDTVLHPALVCCADRSF